MIAEVIQVIKTENCEGTGTKDDIARIVTRYWTLEGDLIAEIDPCPAGKKRLPWRDVAEVEHEQG